MAEKKFEIHTCMDFFKRSWRIHTVKKCLLYFRFLYQNTFISQFHWPWIYWSTHAHKHIFLFSRFILSSGISGGLFSEGATAMGSETSKGLRPRHRSLGVNGEPLPGASTTGHSLKSWRGCRKNKHNELFCPKTGKDICSLSFSAERTHIKIGFQEILFQDMNTRLKD